MQLASVPLDQYSEVPRRLPPGLDLDALALETKAIERCREIDSGTGVLRLSLARGPGGLSLSQTAAWAGMIGFAELSAPAVKYRVDKAADFLEALVSRLLAQSAQARPLQWPGRVLRAVDGSVISELASKGFDWRVHAVFDLGLGRFSSLALTDCHHAESVSYGAPLAGEIRDTPSLPLRLVIVRKPQQAADSTRSKLSRLAKVKQRKLDPRSLTAAGFMILATSLPSEGYLAEDILAAYRLRWQIERAFKRLKSLLHIDQIPTRTPLAPRSWLLAHLVLAVLCDDMTQDFLESSP